MDVVSGHPTLSSGNEAAVYQNGAPDPEEEEELYSNDDTIKR